MLHPLDIFRKELSKYFNIKVMFLDHFKETLDSYGGINELWDLYWAYSFNSEILEKIISTSFEYKCNFKYASKYCDLEKWRKEDNQLGVCFEDIAELFGEKINHESEIENMMLNYCIGDLKRFSFIPPTPPIYIDDFKIKKVIFNNPATIVFWSDGTKTIVKCGANDNYDREKGIAMCICKKLYGNKGSFNEVFKKWIKE